MLITHRKHKFNNPSSLKLLGVVLDPSLSWKQHVAHVSKKLNQTIFLIRNLKQFAPISVVLSAYFALFASHLNYAVTCWGHSCHAKRIFGLQRKVLRIMDGLGYREEVRDSFKKLKVLTFPSIYILQSLLLIKKASSNLLTNQDFHTYNTRFKHNLRPSRLRLKSSRNCTTYYGLHFFNTLPSNIRNLDFPKFKSAVKKILIDNAFYSTAEFLKFKFST